MYADDTSQDVRDKSVDVIGKKTSRKPPARYWMGFGSRLDKYITLIQLGLDKMAQRKASSSDCLFYGQFTPSNI